VTGGKASEGEVREAQQLVMAGDEVMECHGDTALVRHDHLSF
jgi:hypothetical protein